MNNIHVYFITFSSIFVLTDSTKQYGLFKLSVKSLEFCKGPKTKDCAVGSINVTSDNTVSAEVMVIENTAFDNVKIMSFSSENNQTFRMQHKKPCDNLFLKPLFQSMFNASSRCIVPKGLYKISLNIEEMLHKYFGGMYLYGTQRWKSMFYSKHCNFLCAKAVLVLSPRK